MNEKLALNDDILMKIEKPARYIGNEVNAVVKDRDSIDVRFCMCFPDVYEIGMSHLGIQILYDMFNKREDTWCERVYSPWVDLDKVMREEHIPLFALESQDPVKEFDFLGITIQYEMCYTNILQILDLSGIPLHAKDRTEDDPIVIGGGPCTYNPEPIAEFFDMFYIGEGETVYDQLLDIYKENKKNGGSRWDYLAKAAEVEGIYVPAFYDVTYKEDGTIDSFVPNHPNAKEKIKKQLVMDMSEAVYPENPVVPFIRATQDRVVLEIQRGCIRGCRFCQAGHTYRPLRTKSKEVLMKQAEAVLKNSGYEEISLSSLSTSDYGELSGLTECMLDYCEPRHISLSLPSLRADSFSAELMERVQKTRKSGLTFACEAGTQRLRDVINKNIREEDVLHACEIAFQGGWNNVKLYFMMGLPTETYEDLDGISDICKKVAYCWRENTPNRARGVRITASASCFVPKPQTPFQWDAQDTLETFREKQAHLKVVMKTKNVTYNWHDAETSVLEGVIARGDRRQGKAILLAWQRGCKMDGWDQCFDFEKWMQAFRDCGLDPEFYASRQRPLDEVFPWDHIGCGTRKEHLKREWERSREAEITPDCMHQCAGCGASALLKGGKCHV